MMKGSEMVAVHFYLNVQCLLTRSPSYSGQLFHTNVEMSLANMDVEVEVLTVVKRITMAHLKLAVKCQYRMLLCF